MGPWLHLLTYRSTTSATYLIWAETNSLESAHVKVQTSNSETTFSSFAGEAEAWDLSFPKWTALLLPRSLSGYELDPSSSLVQYRSTSHMPPAGIGKVAPPNGGVLSVQETHQVYRITTKTIVTSSWIIFTWKTCWSKYFGVSQLNSTYYHNSFHVFLLTF